MKKIFYPLVLCAAAIAAWGCEKDPVEGSSYKLEVNPQTLNFAATGAEAQVITVTAENVEWEVVTPADAEWLTITADTEAATVTVTAADNSETTERTAKIKIAPVGNDSVDAKTVTVKQAAAGEGGGETGDIKMKLSTRSVKFAGAGETVDVTVTFEGTDEMLPFTCTPDEECDWVTIDIKDGVISFTAPLNDNTASRSAMVTVKPENENIASQKIALSQEAGATGKIDVTLFFPFNFKWDETMQKQAMVTLDGLTGVDARTEGEDGSEAEWIHASLKRHGAEQDPSTYKYYLYVTVDNNMVEQARKGYVILEACVEGESASPVRVEVTQEAGKNGLSTLTEDVELPAFNYVTAQVTPWSKPEAQTTSPWSFEFRSEGLSMNVWGKYVGTGTVMRFTLEGAPLAFDPDEENYSYTLDDGDYVGVTRKAYGEKYEPFTFAKGDNGGIYASAWALFYENDAETASAPLDGTISVKYTGTENSYEITFNLTDDLGHAITGSWTGTLTKLSEGGMREPGGFDGDGGDDDFTTPEL